MWKVLTPRQCALAAADIAELVLHVYEKKYPGDGRPREAIKAARGNDKNKAQVAANAAANAAYAAAPAANAAHAASLRRRPRRRPRRPRRLLRQKVKQTDKKGNGTRTDAYCD